MIVMREEYLATVEEYRGHLDPYMDKLERQGLWEKCERTVLPNYAFGKTGLVYVYTVC